MRSFSKRQIEKSLRQSINNMTSKKMSPNIFINYNEEERMKKNKLFLPLLFTAMAAFIAVFGLGVNYYNKNYKINSSITLDVNPSIMLSTNYYNKVIKVQALNDDGEEILKDINVDNMTPEEATNIIVDELIKQGYLTGDGANLLLTVQNNDLVKAKEIETALLESVNKKFDEEYIAGTVITQVDTIRKNIPEDISNMMETYNISYSKAVFISNIIKKDETLKVEDLATLRINEISKLLNDNNINIGDIVGHNNEDSMYENAELTQARKKLDEATQNKVQAENKTQSLNDEIKEQARTGQNTDATKKALEEAEQARTRAEQEALAAQKSYEEAEANQNKGQSTQNEEANKNSNGQTTTTQSSNGQGSTSEISESTSNQNGTDNSSTNSNRR